MHRFKRHLILVFLAVVGPTAFASESDTDPASYENNYRFSLSYSGSGDGNTAIEFVVAAESFDVSSFDPQVNFSGTILHSDRNSVALRYSLHIQKRVTYSDQASDTKNPFQPVQSVQGGVKSTARVKLGEPIDLLKLGPENVRLTVTVVK